MIRHIVFWKLAESYNGYTKQEIALQIKEKLEQLSATIPNILTLEVGVNYVEDPGNEMISDVVLVSEFGNEADLKAYAAHPDHIEVGTFIKAVTVERRVVDYKI